MCNPCHGKMQRAWFTRSSSPTCPQTINRFYCLLSRVLEQSQSMAGQKPRRLLMPISLASVKAICVQSNLVIPPELETSSPRRDFPHMNGGLGGLPPLEWWLLEKMV